MPNAYHPPASIDQILIATDSCFAPASIIKRFGIVVAEISYAYALPQTPFPSAEESKVFSDKLLKESSIARNTCLDELKQKALDLNANAIIQIDFDYTEYSSTAKNSLLVITIAGSAVFISE